MTSINGASDNSAVTAFQTSAPSGSPAPTNHYKTATPETLAFLLMMNFKKFADPNEPGVITRESLVKIAYGPERGEGISEYDSQMARAILESGPLFDQLDGFSKNKDGKITKESIQAFEAKDNGRFSHMYNHELADHLFRNFDEFRYAKPDAGLYRPYEELTVGRLQTYLSSKKGSAEGKMFVRELLGRSDLLEQLGFTRLKAPVKRDDVEKALPHIPRNT